MFRPHARHLLLFGLSALGIQPAAATDAASIVQQGNGRGAAPCMACHGVDGGGAESTGYPRLAGLDAVYLQRQLDSFANGSRANPVMQPSASALSEAERAALAAYYSAMPLPARFARPAATAPDATGERLALRGDWRRHLPGCVQCHGPGGVGVGPGFPPLAGQPASYLATQLKDWRAGTRRNDPLQLMQHVAKQLTPSEIEAVAGWFAARPLPRQERTP